jgi:hypothetical protein
MMMSHPHNCDVKLQGHGCNLSCQFNTNSNRNVCTSALRQVFKLSDKHFLLPCHNAEETTELLLMFNTDPVQFMHV